MSMLSAGSAKACRKYCVMPISLAHVHRRARLADSVQGCGTNQARPVRFGVPHEQAFHVTCNSVNNDSKDCVPSTDEQQQGHIELPQQQYSAQSIHQPLVWCEGLTTGTFAAEVKREFPRVEWQPDNLVKVLALALPAAAAAVGINSQLPTWLLSSKEAVLALLLPAACWMALGSRVTAGKATTYWTSQTIGTCLLLFPLVDPLLSSLWRPAAEALLGPAPINPLVTTLQQAGAAGQLGDIAAHCLASGVLGPLWEEVFWRGFFLTALTKVLPIPACIALSAFNFAALHLSPHNFLPLLVLGATCDCLYLRSGGNLLAPLMLHGLWNMSQVLQIALLHKDTFV